MKKIKIGFLSLLTTGFLLLDSCSKRLDLAPPIGLSSVEVYADADNYEKVLAKIYAGMSLSCLLYTSPSPRDP